MINFQFYMYELTQKLSFLHVKKFSVLHFKFDIDIFQLYMYNLTEIFSFTSIEIFSMYNLTKNFSALHLQFDIEIFSFTCTI